MAKLPSEIIFDIMSRMPVKSLARFWCVSKLWCGYIDDQQLKNIHGQRYPEELAIMIARTNFTEHPLVSFHTIESKQRSASAGVLKAKKTSSLEFKPTKRSLFNMLYILGVGYNVQLPIKIQRCRQGSCNGLVYFSQDYWMVHPSYVSVVNPLRKEYYELPPVDCPLDQYHFWLHGLNFDDSTNTFKMVFLLPRENLCAMVHVFGTRSWRQISQDLWNPINIYTVKDVKKAVFAGGCLRWLADHNGKIIRLDMRTEEFGLIDLSKIHGHSGIDDRLVDLHGEVGYVYGHNLKVWVLKQMDWVIHCRFDHKPPLPACGIVRVLGGWNKDGDILMETDTARVGKQLFIYCRESGILKEVKLNRKPDDEFITRDTFIYNQRGLFLIHVIKAYSIKG